MRRPDWVDPTLYPFADRELELDGTRVHYVDEGDGPPLLLLHGNPTWSFAYRHLIVGLRDRFRCVAPDLPGFGLSAASPGYGFTPAEHAAVLGRFVEALDLRGLTLLVQDWGGPIGLAVAVRAPERVAGLVLANTWAWPRGDLGARAYAWGLGGPPGRLLVERLDLVAGRLLPRALRRPGDPAVLAHYRGPFPTPASRRPIRVITRSVTAAEAFLAEVQAGLPRLAERPALILWPERDPIFGAGDRSRLARAFPRHELVLLEDAGHFFAEDAPEAAVAAIRAWAQRESG